MLLSFHIQTFAFKHKQRFKLRKTVKIKAFLTLNSPKDIDIKKMAVVRISVNFGELRVNQSHDWLAFSVTAYVEPWCIFLGWPSEIGWNPFSSTTLCR